MTFNPDEIYHKIVEAGEEWADKQAAAELLEETKKSVLAEIANSGAESAVAAREARALADPAYKLHIINMVTARREANKARVRYDGVKVLSEMRRSQESTRRSEMNLR